MPEMDWSDARVVTEVEDGYSLFPDGVGVALGTQDGRLPLFLALADAERFIGLLRQACDRVHEERQAHGDPPGTAQEPPEGFQSPQAAMVRLLPDGRIHLEFRLAQGRTAEVALPLRGLTELHNAAERMVQEAATPGAKPN